MRCYFLKLTLLFALSFLSLTQKGCSASESALVTRVPFELINEAIYLTLKVNDLDSLRFLFDTGASMPLISNSLAGRLNLKNGVTSSSTGLGGKYATSIFTGNSISLGGIIIDDVKLMKSQGELGGEQKDGIIGYDILSHYVVRIDYDHQYLKLYSFDDFDHRGIGEEMDLSFMSKLPFVSFELDIGNKRDTADLILDTGAAGYLLLTTDFIVQNKIKDRIKKSIERKMVIGVDKNEVLLTGFSIDQVRLSSYTFNKVPSSFSDVKVGAMAFEEVDGLVGNIFLKRFNTTYNYRSQKVYFEPSGYIYKAIPIDCLGISWKEQEGKFIVNTVLDKSVAQEHGLIPGDELIGIDSIPASEITKELLQAIFTQDGREVTVKYRRDGEMRKVKMVLRAML